MGFIAWQLYFSQKHSTTPLDKNFSPRHTASMVFQPEFSSSLDSLWKEYGGVGR
jgi:hypothetical protein